MIEAYEIDVAEKCEREASNLGLANFMIDGRVAKIMHAIYREEEKPNPDAVYLAALDTSHKAVWDDRHAMQGRRPDAVEAMIAKYDRLQNAEPTVHE